MASTIAQKLPAERDITLNQTATSQKYSYYVLGVLFFVALFSYLDRMILAILVEPIKAEFALSDTQVGVLTGLAFALFYASFGIPLARMADTGNRARIIAWSLAAWSIMTAACGFAQNFVQLLLARIGVAIGEAGAVPPSHSLIADYFAPERRAWALSLFTLGSTVGYLIGFALGGVVAEQYGWRMAFLLVGFPGLLFALVVRFTLVEPRESSDFKVAQADDSMVSAMQVLKQKRSFLYIILGFSTYSVLSYGANQWVASFLIRTHGMGLAEVGLKYGMVVSLSTAAGVLFGGWISDRLYRRDPRWTVRIPSLACLLALPVSLLAFSVEATSLAIALMGVLGFCFGVTTPPAMAAVHAVAGERRRALAIAVVFLMTNIVGFGFGPVLIGFLSDTLQASSGVEALGQGILYAHFLLLFAAGFFLLAQSSLIQDME